MHWSSRERWAFLALLGGATGIGFAPIFVRLSEVGPSATAFYRLLFALPVFWIALPFEHSPGLELRRGIGPDNSRSAWWLCAVAGALFAGDLAFWHWSVKLTTVANATLLTNCAPFVVMFGARWLFGERITVWLLLGLGVALVGAVLLVGASLQVRSSHLVGDALGFVTAFFYGGYLLSVKHLRRRLSTVRILAWSGLVSCALLLGIALCSRENLRLHSAFGWEVVIGLALLSHVAGQGLIGYALAHLPAGFSSLSLLLQPIVAAILARVVLAESISPLQAVGGAVVLLGIALASRAPSQKSRPFSNTADQSHLVDPPEARRD